MDKNIDLGIEQIESNTKEILRRMDNQDRLLELIYKDRELINEAKEDIAGSKQRTVDSTKHIENVVKDHTFEMSKQVEEIKDVVENKGNEVKKDIVKGIAKEVSK